MKMRLLTGLIAAACFSQAASAAELSNGTISNQTIATADVMFSQPITLENTLTPIAGLKAGASDDNRATQIANGKLAIKDSGVTALLALKFMNLTEPFLTYAEGHEGDEDYAMLYAPIPKDVEDLNEMPSKYDTFTSTDGLYTVTPKANNHLDYKVVAYNTKNNKFMAGKYNISVTGAVYTP